MELVIKFLFRIPTFKVSVEELAMNEQKSTQNQLTTLKITQELWVCYFIHCQLGKLASERTRVGIQN